MIKSDLQRARLAKLAEICLRLPKATREDKGQHSAFLIGKRTFVYYLSDHHGDGMIGICCKVLPGEASALIAAAPAKFYVPAYLGSRGWVGLRLDGKSVDWREVSELVRGSYAQLAPKRLRPRADKTAQ